jgi:hypothetical protein
MVYVLLNVDSSGLHLFSYGHLSLAIIAFDVIPPVMLIWAPWHSLLGVNIWVCLGYVAIGISLFTFGHVVVAATCLGFLIIHIIVTWYTHLSRHSKSPLYICQTIFVFAAGIIQKHPGTLALIFLAPLLVVASLLPFCIFFTLQFSIFGFTAFWFFVLSMYWTLETIKYCLHTIIASVIVSHIFVPQERWATLNACKRTIFYSLGSIGIGALGMTPVAMARIFSLPLRKPESLLDGEIKWYRRLGDWYHSSILSEIAIYGRAYSGSTDSASVLRGFHDPSRRLMDQITYLDIVLYYIMLMFSGAGAMGSFLFEVSFPGARADICLLLAGIWMGWTGIAIVLETVRAGVYALLVCYAEDPKRIQDALPDLYELVLCPRDAPQVSELDRV